MWVCMCVSVCVSVWVSVSVCECVCVSECVCEWAWVCIKAATILIYLRFSNFIVRVSWLLSNLHPCKSDFRHKPFFKGSIILAALFALPPCICKGTPEYIYKNYLPQYIMTFNMKAANYQETSSNLHTKVRQKINVSSNINTNFKISGNEHIQL
jgi:hypothetical protein